jgi:predicted nucleic acid-binding protein
MMKDELFLDTSGLLSLFDEGDERHQKASDIFAKARFLLTTNYVLAEFVPLTRVRGLSREKSLRFLQDLVLLPRIEVVWIDDKRHQEAMNLLDHRLDKTYSLCDAVSFVLMRERQINEALTTDKHFVQEGFVRLLDP